ncbi:hypothetical protein EV360DRAFT_73782 [Lentinula raphanica]|nr:hypothetical protein EV360DRAFT_73782 [Lentinula raphanica]
MPSVWQQELYFAVRETSSINDVALSEDARYLAVAYGVCVDIWDLKNTTNAAPLAQYKPNSLIHPISFLIWSPGSYRLAICFEAGLVCVITMNMDGGEKFSLAVGFCFESGQGSPRSKVFAAFLREDILAVAMGRDVEIRYFLDSNNDPRWDLKSTLAASTPPMSRYPSVGDIQSIHWFTGDRILISYENHVADLWMFKQSPEGFLTYTHKLTMTLPGIINDVSPAKGTILVAAAGTYQVLVLGSTTAQGIFIPRDPITKYPQTASCARYLSDDVIIGAGTGQLVLWNIDLGNRLQNLPLLDKDGGPTTYHICYPTGNRQPTVQKKILGGL